MVKYVYVDVKNHYLITYNANGGLYDNNESINIVGYEKTVKYSHTSNIDDTGKN